MSHGTFNPAFAAWFNSVMNWGDHVDPNAVGVSCRICGALYLVDQRHLAFWKGRNWICPPCGLLHALGEYGKEKDK